MTWRVDKADLQGLRANACAVDPSDDKSCYLLVRCPLLIEK